MAEEGSAVRTAEKLLKFHRRDLDMYVDAVEQWAADPIKVL